ncbi:MAG: hypothetical protein ACXVWU_05945 [Nocardioides sp.]
MGVGRLVATALAVTSLALTCTSCRDSAPSTAGASASSSPAPRLGGPRIAAAPVPHGAMSRLERPVAARIAAVARRQGLRLDYLHCPAWDHTMPMRLTCTGWFDGVTAEVLLRLHRVAYGSVVFDARIGRGVIATSALVRRLREHGAEHVDCGRVPAYPARVGLEVVCATGTGSSRRYVTATVTDTSGAVAILHD